MKEIGGGRGGIVDCHQPGRKDLWKGEGRGGEGRGGEGRGGEGRGGEGRGGEGRGGEGRGDYTPTWITSDSVLGLTTSPVRPLLNTHAQADKETQESN